VVDTTARFPRPVPIGVSTGHPDITACTIGARLTDGTNVFALSNNHCYADENRASIGDPAIQPGTYDGGASPADDIGTLADFEPIIFGNFGKCPADGETLVPKGESGVNRGTCAHLIRAIFSGGYESMTVKMKGVS